MSNDAQGRADDDRSGPEFLSRIPEELDPEMSNLTCKNSYFWNYISLSYRFRSVILDINVLGLEWAVGGLSPEYELSK